MPAAKKNTEPEVQVELLETPVESPAINPETETSEVSMPTIAPTIPAGMNLSEPVVTDKPEVSTSGQPKEAQVSNWASEMQDGDHAETTVDRQTSKWIVMIVVLILLILAAAGGVVFYLTQYGIQGKISTVSPAPDTPAVQPTPSQAMDEQTIELNQMGTEDNLDAIKKDVENTKLDTLDNGLDEVEKDL